MHGGTNKVGNNIIVQSGMLFLGRRNKGDAQRGNKKIGVRRIIPETMVDHPLDKVKPISSRNAIMTLSGGVDWHRPAELEASCNLSECISNRRQRIGSHGANRGGESISEAR